MTQQRGFTLLELTITIAIVAVLTAIAIPTYRIYLAKSQISEAFSLTNGLKPEVIVYMNHNAECPRNDKDGFPAAASISGAYVAAVHLGGTYPSNGHGNACTITAKFDNGGVSGGISGGSLTLQAQLNQGAVFWNCSSADIEQRYLPAGCRSSS